MDGKYLLYARRWGRQKSNQNKFWVKLRNPPWRIHKNTFNFKRLKMLLIEMPWPTHRSQMCLKTKADWHIIGFERVLVEANKAGILIPWCFCCISKTSWSVQLPFKVSDQLLSRSNGAQIFSSSELLGPHPSSPWGGDSLGKSLCNRSKEPYHNFVWKLPKPQNLP